MVKLVDGDTIRDVNVGELLSPSFDKKLGSPLYLKIISKEGVEYYSFPAKVRGKWMEGEIVYFNTQHGRRVFLDTLAHVIEVAVKRLYPEYLLAGRDVKETEARVDFYTGEKPFSESDLEKILLEVKRIIGEGGSFTLITKNKEEIIKSLSEKGETLLIELTKMYDLPVLIEKKGVYTVCDVSEHLPSLDIIKVIEITNTSMSHWMGKEEGKKLYSIHVTGFPSEEDRRIHHARLEEIRKRDHVKLGREMDIFLTSPLVGQGLPLWAPNGAMLKKLLEDYIVKVHLKNGYQLVQTPHIASAELFKISGHLQHYREHMFLFEMEGREHAIKPMNCPFHIQILKRKKWSYRELPVRYFELGNVYRYERAGTLHGLTRVRGFVIDDAHIFLREDQIEEEITQIIRMMNEIYSTFGLKDYEFTLSLRDPENKKKYMGNPRTWEIAEKALETALKKMGVNFTKEIGEAAFYGPKIDVKFRDALGREWQCATIQLDFNLPEKFDLKYIDENNEEKRMVIIHRALLGSVERFIGILLEHYAGRLPLWLSPIQVAVLPVDERDKSLLTYTTEIHRVLQENDIRSVLLSEGRLGARVREARKLRIPLLVMVGRKEMEGGYLTVKYIRYGVDEENRFKPIEEEMKLESEKELVEWIKKKVREQTNNML